MDILQLLYAIITLLCSKRYGSLHMQHIIVVSLTVEYYSCLWQQVMVSGYQYVCAHTRSRLGLMHYLGNGNFAFPYFITLSNLSIIGFDSYYTIHTIYSYH